MEDRIKNKVIAVFDFDDTITDRDTLFDFIRFYVGGYKFLIGLLLLFPVLVLFKIGLLSNEYAKQKMLSYFLKNSKQSDFENAATNYANRITAIVKPEAIEKMRWHQNEGHTIVIVSASVSSWIKPWAEFNGVNQVLGTEMELQGGKFTGKFCSKNCHGQEKVNRLLAAYPDRNSYSLFVYGDSSGDKELLAFADYAFFRKFN